MIQSILRLSVAALSSTALCLAATAALAATPEEAAARLEALGVENFGKKPTAATIGDISMLSFHGDRAKSVTDADCALFAMAPKITTISFAGSRLGKACLAELAKLPKLGSLTFGNGDLEPGAVPELAAAKQLESLSFADVGGLSPADVAPLAALPNLRFFSLGYTMIPPGRTPWHDDRMLAEVAKLTSVQRLSLSRLAATARGMAEIARMPALTDLTLNHGLFDGAALAPLAGSKLTGLTLTQNYRLGQGTAAAVAQIAGLTRLDLTTTAVGGDLGALAKLPRLRDLSVSGAFVTDADAVALAAAPALVTLNANDNPMIGDTGAKALATSKTLESIALARTTITDASIAGLAAMPTLRTLYAGENALGDGVAAFAATPKLTLLDVAGSDLGDTGLAALAKVPALTSLTVRKTRVSEAGLAAFKAARPTVGLYK